jgi:predicted Fe-Mo cluster-binding NifX family protein
MKVALTVWEGRISPVFDVCREALIVTIENGTVVSRTRAAVDAPNAVFKVRQLADLGVETLVCGAISEPLDRDLTERGVRVIGFVAGKVETVIAAFVASRLPSPELSMPGCCIRRNHVRGGRVSGPERRHGRGSSRETKSS